MPRARTAVIWDMSKPCISGVDRSYWFAASSLFQLERTGVTLKIINYFVNNFGT